MNSKPHNLIRSTSRVLIAALTVFAVLELESCANSIQILPTHTNRAQDVGRLSDGTAYIQVDMSNLGELSRKEEANASSTLGTAIARDLGSAFRHTRAVPDLGRLEPESADLVILVRAGNLIRPKQWGDVSRGWLRILVVGVLAEVYNIVALDFPEYRNNVVLPFAAVAFSLYDLIYCHQYENTKGNLTLDYQLSVLKSDGTVINRHLFADSAKVLVQADARVRDLHLTDFFDATTTELSASVQKYVLADSTVIRNLGEELNRAYPDPRDRLLSFKKNVYRALDDTTSAIN